MTTAPIRFEVLVNGEPFASFGVDNPYGVLTALVNWVRRDPAALSERVRSRPGFSEAAFLEASCELELSSLDSASQQHRSWGHCPLAAGDVVTIRVLSGGASELTPDSANSDAR